MAYTNSRIGSGRSKKKILLIGGLGLVTVIVGGSIFIAVISDGEIDESATEAPCRSDHICAQGQICAAGGCLLLIPSESESMWLDDIAAQLNPATPWQPMNAFGERLLAPSLCPPSSGKTSAPAESKTELLAQIRVFELRDAHIRIYQHLRAKSSVWLDTLRFWFDDRGEFTPSAVCASSNINRIHSGTKRRLGKKMRYVDAALHQTVPSGATATGAIAIRHELPDQQGDELRALTFTLNPQGLDSTKTRTVVTLPLGSDLEAIEGPPPDEQRLLVGFAAYYWNHPATKSRVTIRFRVPTAASAKLDMSSLNP